MAKRQDTISGYLYPLDGLRAISVILIFMFHTWQQSWIYYKVEISRFITLNFEPFQRYGYLAIDFFFVLSGFGLFYPIARSIFKESEFKGWKDFFVKRLRRIYPAYIIIFLLVLIIPGSIFFTFDKNNAVEWVKNILTNIFFVNNCNNYNPSTILSTAWTLAMEVHFYLLFPLICIPFKKKPVLTAIGMAAVAVAFRLWAICFSPLSQVMQACTLGYFDVFGLGMLAAYFVVAMRNKVKNVEKLKKYMTAISVLSLIAVLGFFEWIGLGSFPQGSDGPTYFRFLYRGIMDIFVALFIFSACFSADLWQKRILGNRVFIFISSISYSFYLLHQNVYIFLKAHNIPHSDMNPVMDDKPAMWGLTFICLGVTLGLSILITKFVEQPIAKYGYKGYFKNICSFVKQKSSKKAP